MTLPESVTPDDLMQRLLWQRRVLSETRGYDVNGFRIGEVVKVWVSPDVGSFNDSKSPTVRKRLGDPRYADSSEFQMALYDTLYLKRVHFRDVDQYEAAVRIWIA